MKKRMILASALCLMFTFTTSAMAMEIQPVAEDEIQAEIVEITGGEFVRVRSIPMNDGFTDGYVIMDLTKGSDVLWEESFYNETDITKKLICSWLMGSLNEAYMNVYLTNTGDTMIRVTLMKDGAGGNVNEIGGTPYDLAPGESKLFKLSGNEIMQSMSNNLYHGQVYVKCANMNLDSFSVQARVAFYS